MTNVAGPIVLPEKVARLPEYAQQRYIIKHTLLAQGVVGEWYHDRFYYEGTRELVPGVRAIPKPPEVMARRHAFEERRKANQRRVKMAKRRSKTRRATKHFSFGSDFASHS